MATVRGALEALWKSSRGYWACCRAWKAAPWSTVVLGDGGFAQRLKHEIIGYAIRKPLTEHPACLKAMIIARYSRASGAPTYILATQSLRPLPDPPRLP